MAQMVVFGTVLSAIGAALTGAKIILVQRHKSRPALVHVAAQERQR